MSEKNEAQKLYEIWENHKSVINYKNLLLYKQQRKKSYQVLGLTDDQVVALRRYKVRMGL